MPKILVVEDDPFFRKLYERLFALKGIQVDLAGEGTEGIQKAKTVNPGLILLDIMMPGISGLDVLKTLKEDPSTKSIPVVMLTNLGDDAAIEKATKLGADGYFVKSNTQPEQLLEDVSKFIKTS